MGSTSHAAVTLTRPEAIASRRMFLPHHPGPMMAVVSFRSCTYGEASSAAPEARTCPRVSMLVPQIDADDVPRSRAAEEAPAGEDRRRPALAFDRAAAGRRLEPGGRRGRDEQFTPLRQHEQLASRGGQRAAAQAV